MKKIIAAALLTLSVAASHAATVGAWNYATAGVKIKEVRQNGNGFWFNVQNPVSGDVGKWFGSNNNATYFNVMVSVVLAAKTADKPVDFFVQSANLNGDPAVYQIIGVTIK